MAQEERGFSQATTAQHHHHEGSGPAAAQAVAMGDESVEAMMLMNYGMSNEGGTMLARGLLARELQARELLAREMGSQTGSLDRRRRSKPQRRFSSRTYAGDSSNISLDGSTLSRIRWEPEPVDPNQHESTSLPAEFLYFKFEQIVARWIKQKKSSSVASIERLRPKEINRPPKTITTITNTTPDDKNVPRFMRNTTTSSSRTGRATSASPDKKNSPKQQATTSQSGSRSRTPQKSGANTARRRPSPSPRRNTNDRRRSSPSPLRNKEAPFRRNSPLRMTESQRQKQATVANNNNNNNKKKTQPSRPSSNTRNRTPKRSTMRVETRSPTNTTENNDAQHYFRKESSTGTSQDDGHHHHNGRRIYQSKLPPIPHFNSSSKPDPEQSRPDPEGDRWPSSPQRQSKNPNAAFRSQSPQQQRNQIATAASRDTATSSSSPGDAQGGESQARSATPTASSPSVTTSSPSAKITNSKTPSPLRGAAASSTRSTSPTTNRAIMNPNKKSNFPKTTPPNTTNTKRRKSRLPPLPSFRNSSPKPSQRNDSSEPTTAAKDEPSPSSSKAKSPASPRNGGTLSKAIPTDETKRSTDAPPSSPKAKPSPVKTNTSPRNGAKSLSPRKPSPGKKSIVDVASRLHKGVPTTRQRNGKMSPRPSPVSFPRRYGRKHTYSAIMLQSFGRMLPDRRKFLAIRRAVIMLQSIVRQKFEVKSFKQTKKGTRMQHFSCIVIQRNVRMFSCRLSFLHLRYSVIVAQSAIRMFSCRSTFLELRSASQKLLGRNTIQSPPVSPRQQVATVRGGRLRIYSALLIQSLARMRWVRAAFLELRSSAVVIQKWHRNVLTKKFSAVRVLQKWARMLSWRSCFLDLRDSVLLLQKWTRMSLIRAKYLKEKRIRTEYVSASLIQSFHRRNTCRAKYLKEKRARLEHVSASLIQALYRRSACQEAYHQLRSSSKVLQVWARARAVRFAFLSLQQACTVLQCWARQRISERVVFELICIRLIQAAFRAFKDRCIFSAKRASVSMIQALVRGHICKARFSSLQLATLAVQKWRRVKVGRTYAANRRLALWVEATKLKKSKMNNIANAFPESMDTISDAVSSTQEEPQSDKSKDEISGENASDRPTQYDDVVSAALAFVSHNSSQNTKKRIDSSHESPASDNPEESSLTQASAVKPMNRTLTQRKNSGKKHRAIMLDPDGDNMSRVSRKPPVYSGRQLHVQEAPKTPPLDHRRPVAYGVAQNSAEDLALHFPQHYDQPERFNSALENTQHTRYMGIPPRQGSLFSSFPMSQSISNDLAAPSDMLSRMSPVELSPQQPMYMLSHSSDGSQGSPQLYALQPLNELPQPQPQNPYLYYVSTSHTGQQNPMNTFGQELKQPFEKPTQSVGLKDSTLGGSKQGKTKTRVLSAKDDAIPMTKEYPPIPSIVENPSYYLPKKEVTTQAKENDPTSAEADVYEMESPSEDDDNVPPANPLKLVLQNRHTLDIMLPKLKKTEDVTDRAITEKLAAIKQRSRARKVQRWTKRTLKRDKTSNKTRNRPQEEAKKDMGVKRPFIDIAVEQWAKQTIQRRKMSIFTRGLDGDFATQIQAAWRSHRDQLLLASLLLQTWSVNCEFGPDTMNGDRLLRQNANVFALDGAFCQVGYHWQNGKLLVKHGLVMVQWHGLVLINFSDHGLPADDTCCTVSVHCTAKKSPLLDSWSERKRSMCLVKAAIAKNSHDQRQKLRRSSMFNRSLTRRRTDPRDSAIPARDNDSMQETRTSSNRPHGGKYYRLADSAIVIQRAYRRFQVRGIPTEFEARMRFYSAVLIQSWYRMCVCRSMYQGLRRIQSRILLRFDNDDVETIKSPSLLVNYACETIVEEEGGFECTTGSSSED